VGTEAGTLIVTGGAGFIGANFVHHALAHTDDRVVVLDALTYAGHLESLAEIQDHPRYRFVRGDIADRETVRAVFREHRPTAVLNLAAETHVDRSIDAPAEFVRTNLVGTFELLEAARGYLSGVPEAERASFRFVHVSTDEVYGSLGETGRFSETTPYAPNSPYAASKAGADHLVRAYYETYRLSTLITNCSNNFGRFQYPEKLIPLMILNAVEGRPLPVYGDGGNVRDWLFVEDHCAAVLQVLKRGEPGGKYNIGGDNEHTNLEVVEALCATLERERPAAENPALQAQGSTGYRELLTLVPDRPGHDRRYAIDASRIRRELGWRPRHDFEQGLAETVRWYLAHPEWCRAVQAGRYDRQRLGLGQGATS
jgi:dTDP-glucose 4,6-dehydratase